MTETPFWTPSQPPAAKEPPPINGAGSDEPARSATSEVANVAPDSILQLGLAFWGSKTLLSAVELGVFTELARRPLKAQILMERLGLNERGARDFFDALVALGMLEREGDNYRNTAATALFLDRNKPSYVGGLLEMANARLYPFWGNLTEALRSGEPQNEVKNGENFFTALYADTERLGGFLKAMTGVSMGAARAIAEKFPWGNYKSFADLGCAQGALPIQVAIAHPHLKGIGFDLPPVQPHFESFAAAQGLSHRLSFQGGDFFADPLPPTEVYVMGHILHDWNLEEKKLLIRKAYEALPPNGALIIYEAMIDDDRRQNAFGLLMSLNMLIETPGGSDYTCADGIGWMREAGFRKAHAQHLVGPESMVVGMK